MVIACPVTGQPFSMFCLRGRRWQQEREDLLSGCTYPEEGHPASSPADFHWLVKDIFIHAVFCFLHKRTTRKRSIRSQGFFLFSLFISMQEKNILLPSPLGTSLHHDMEAMQPALCHERGQKTASWVGQRRRKGLLCFKKTGQGPRKNDGTKRLCPALKWNSLYYFSPLKQLFLSVLFRIYIYIYIIVPAGG